MEWEDAHLWGVHLRSRAHRQQPRRPPTIEELLRPRITKLGYTYDMGDCWEHQLILTKPRAAHPALAYPRYVAGENPAPPEDCGGTPGFYALLHLAAWQVRRTVPISIRSSRPSPS